MASASARERTAAICTLYLPDLTAGAVAAAGAGAAAGVAAAVCTAFAGLLGLPAPSATDAPPDQLELADCGGVVEAVVTEAGAVDELLPPPPNKFEKNPATEEPGVLVAGAGAALSDGSAASEGGVVGCGAGAAIGVAGSTAVAEATLDVAGVTG